MRILFLTTFFILSSFVGQAKALEITPDGPKLVSLAEDAYSVIVGNPAHATVTMDNPRLLIISAGQPGMTRLTVLGENGRVIMNESLIVNGPNPGMVRVRNACINGADECQPTRMYYCEDGKVCHNMIINEEPVSGNGGGAGATGSSTGATSIVSGVAEGEEVGASDTMSGSDVDFEEF